MEFQAYLNIVKKWLWLAVVVVAIAAGTSYYYSLRIPPTYQASSTLLVGRVMQDPNPSSASLAVASSLVQAHAMLATQPPVLQGAAEALHWQGSWQDLYFIVSAQTPGGQLLVISTRTRDPKLAADVANEVARQVMLLSPASAAQRQSEDQAAFLSGQLKQLTGQIENAQKSLNDLTTQATIETDSTKLTALQARIDALQVKIDGWQKNYATLSTLLNSGSSSFLTVLTPAVPPSTPVSPNIPLNVLLGGFAGLLLAAAAATLFEFMDDRIRDTDDVQRTLGVTALGSISRMPGIRQSGDSIVTLKNPRAPSAEAYRVLRTNLRLSGIKSSGAALLVTSAAAGEGKTTTAANLAVTMAQIGKRVVLVDTDLRRPAVHKFFGFTNDSGLTNLFLGDQLARDHQHLVQETQIAGLYVMTSGPLPPNPAELLDSAQMGEIMDNLRADYDMVILDSPPVLAFADASILGSRCSAALMVIDGGKTRTGASRRALKMLAQAKTKVIGIVVNKLHPDPAMNQYYGNS